jgi:inosine/xanthosine triphosphate pyrophosphatase family protein
MSKRQYSDNDKAIALATLDANEGSIRQTAKILRIPETTLSDWANNRGICSEVTEIRDVKKAELVDKLEEVAHALTDNILQRAQSDFSLLTPLKDFAVSLGIAVDKMQVLKGKPTSISQDVSDHSHEERAARILELVKPARTG